MPTRTSIDPGGATVTMATVAKLAGVSPAAVSAVVNPGRSSTIRISDQTRQHIKQVIRQTGYRPNRIGRALVSGRSLLIGVVVRDVASSFVPQCIAAIEDVADQHGYGVILTSTRQRPERLAHAFDLVMRKHVDGLILGTDCEVDPRSAEAIQRQKVRVAYVNHRPASPLPNSGNVCVDGERVGHLGIQHLLQAGHTHIACVGAGPWMRQGIDRASHALHEPPHIEHWSHDYLAKHPMEEVFGRWIAMTKRPTALFFNGDHLACSFMNLALRNGLRIPEDLAILGVDNAPQSAEAVVPLTTVAQPKYKQGEMAAQILFDLIDGQPPRQVILQPELIIRSSTQVPDRA